MLPPSPPTYLQRCRRASGGGGGAGVGAAAHPVLLMVHVIFLPVLYGSGPLSDRAQSAAAAARRGGGPLVEGGSSGGAGKGGEAHGASASLRSAPRAASGTWSARAAAGPR